MLFIGAKPPRATYSTGRPAACQAATRAATENMDNNGLSITSNNVQFASHVRHPMTTARSSRDACNCPPHVTSLRKAARRIAYLVEMVDRKHDCLLQVGVRPPVTWFERFTPQPGVGGGFRGEMRGVDVG